MELLGFVAANFIESDGIYVHEGGMELIVSAYLM